MLLQKIIFTQVVVGVVCFSISQEYGIVAQEYNYEKKVSKIFHANMARRTNRIKERKGESFSNHVSETFLEIPSIDMRIALSTILSEFHANSLLDDLKDLTVKHMTDFYRSYVNEKATSSYTENIAEGSNSSSFDRFFMAATMKAGDYLGERSNQEKHNHHTRFLQKPQNDESPVSFVNAEFNGYAVYHGTVSNDEKEIINDLPTLAFIGENHEDFIRKVKASEDKSLSSVLQVSVTAQRNKLQVGTKPYDEKKHIQDVRLNFVLLFVLGCFFVGALVGGFVVHRYSEYFEREDDKTEETSTSKGSFSALNAMRKGALTKAVYSDDSASKFVRKIFSRDPKPAVSISIDNNENNLYLNTNADNENLFQKSKTLGKKRAKKKKSRKVVEKRRFEDINLLTAIEEESDGDLYIDFVDDIVMVQMQEKQLSFPTLQARLSNVRTKHLIHQSFYENSYNDIYTPTNCPIPSESINENNIHTTYMEDNNLEKSNFMSSSISLEMNATSPKNEKEFRFNADSTLRDC